MLTMLREPDEKSRTRRRDRGEDFVPYFGLSDYAETQYKAIRNADTGIKNVTDRISYVVISSNIKQI